MVILPGGMSFTLSLTSSSWDDDEVGGVISDVTFLVLTFTVDRSSVGLTMSFHLSKLMAK